MHKQIILRLFLIFVRCMFCFFIYWASIKLAILISLKTSTQTSFGLINPGNAIIILFLNHTNNHICKILYLLSGASGYIFIRARDGTSKTIYLSVALLNCAEEYIISLLLTRYLDLRDPNTPNSLRFVRRLSLILFLCSATIAAIPATFIIAYVRHSKHPIDTWYAFFLSHLLSSYEILYNYYVFRSYIILQHPNLHKIKQNNDDNSIFNVNYKKWFDRATWTHVVEYAIAIVIICILFSFTDYKQYGLATILCIFPILGWIGSRYSQISTAIIELILCITSITFTIYELGPVIYINKYVNQNNIIFYNLISLYSLLLITNVTAAYVSITMSKIKTADIKSQESIKEKLDLFSNVSHELRTPLNAISGFTNELLQNSEGYNKQNLEKIALSAEIMNNLVNDILELVRIDALGVELTIRSVETKNFVYSITSLCEALANQKNITFTVLNELPTFLLFDDKKVYQIVINICSNAIKYTHVDGTVKISFKKNDSNMLIAVEDNGSGIAKEDISKIFDKFYRCKNNKNDSMGSGIGLSIVQKLIIAMNGHIEIVSELEKGTKVTIIIPVQAEKINNSGQSDSPNALIPAITKQLKILIVDDAIIILDLLSLMLKEHKLKILNSAEDIYDILLVGIDTQAFDLLLLDMHINDTVGTTIVTNIRTSNTDYCSIPIIIISGIISSSEKKILQIYKNIKYLQKPVNKHDLLKTINELLTIWLV